MKRILLTRSPVCMADDARDNSLEIEVDDNWRLDEILNKVLSMGYLPEVYGGKATWSVACEKTIEIVAPYKAVAIIAQQWSEPRFIRPFESEYCNKLHFTYYGRENPEALCKRISRLRSL